MFLCLNIGVRSRYPLSLFESGILVTQCPNVFPMQNKKKKKRKKKKKKMALLRGRVRLGSVCPYCVCS